MHTQISIVELCACITCYCAVTSLLNALKIRFRNENKRFFCFLLLKTQGTPDGYYLTELSVG